MACSYIHYESQEHKDDQDIFKSQDIEIQSLHNYQEESASNI